MAWPIDVDDPQLADDVPDAGVDGTALGEGGPVLYPEHNDRHNAVAAAIKALVTILGDGVAGSEIDVQARLDTLDTDLADLVSDLATGLAGKASTSHAATHKGGGTDAIDAATTVLAGLMSALDKAKLDGIESGATADQTAAEILTKLLTVDGVGSLLDADLLDGLHAAAFATAAQGAKVDFLTVTQPVDLDAIETRVNDLDAAVVLRGTWDASAGTFPGGGTAQAGSSYIVSVAGTVDGVAFNINDRVIAIVDNASTTTYASNWHKADYTDEVLSVAGRTGAITLTKSDVGLGSVDNTADTAKPVSTAQQTALNLKADLASPALTGNPTAPDQSAGTNNSRIANTKYVDTACGLLVPKSLFDANSILIATTDDTPAALTVGASTHVGRKSSGNIVALTPAESATILSGIEHSASDFKATGVASLANAVDGRYIGQWSTSGAPTGLTGVVRDWGFDGDGLLWRCTVAGTPGTWITKQGTFLSGVEITTSPSTFTGVAASRTDLSSTLTLTVTVGARPVVFQLMAPNCSNNTADSGVGLTIEIGTIGGGTGTILQQGLMHSSAAGRTGVINIRTSASDTRVTGTITVKVMAYIVTSGTGTVSASAGQRVTLEAYEV